MLDQDSARMLAMEVMERRLDALNHNHATMAEQNAEFLRIATYNRAHEELSKRIALIENEMATNRGQSHGIALSWQSITAGAVLIGIIVGLLDKVLHP